MADNWPLVQLGDVVEFATGFPFKSDQYTDDDSAVRLLRGDNIGQGILRWGGVRRWPKNATADVEAYWLQKGDVVLAMDRPWIEAGLKYAAVRHADLPALLVQRVARLRGTSMLDTTFLQYIIRSRPFTEHVLAVQTGTAVPHISGNQIKSFTFALPPRREQQAIGLLLGTLDDKIDLNGRANETLEGVARAIFKSWFVDFDPVRAKVAGCKTGLPEPLDNLFPDSFEESKTGGIPKGWARMPFAETVEIIGGGTPETSVADYWNGEIPWFSVVDAPNESDVWVIDTEKKITRAGVDNSSARILSVGTTIISARGTVGRIAMVGVPMAMNQSCYGLRGLSGSGDTFTYFSTRQLVSRLQQHAHGSVFDTITRKTFMGVDVASPPESVVATFEKTVEPIVQRIRTSLFQSRALSAMRDALLPNLISGKLRIKDAEHIVGRLL